MSKELLPYQEYSEAEQEWLNSIPSHWELKRVKFLLLDGAEGIKIGPFGSALKLEDMVSAGYKVYGQENVIKRDFSRGKRLISESKFREMSVYTVAPGDILITMMGTSGKCQVVPRNVAPGIIDSHLLRIRTSDSHIEPRLFQLLVDESHEVKFQIGKQGKGSIMHGLNSSIVKELLLPLPPIAEQQKLLSFLDHETAKIDQLIAKQERLIELLKEKRQAVISHAVTKGLNPDAKIKHSGVEWLGEVPEHWVVKRLKHISPRIGVGLVINPSTYVKDEGNYFLFGGDIKEYGFRLDKTRKISPEDSKSLKPSYLTTGDLVCVRVGYPGITAVIPKELEGANCASMMVIKRGAFNSDWLCAAMNSWVGRRQVERVQYGAAQKQYNIADAIEFKFPVPPKPEQDEIANFITAKLDHFAKISSKCEQNVTLLKERRSALISAAVTGKIDVRDWQPQDSSAKAESMTA